MAAANFVVIKEPISHQPIGSLTVVTNGGVGVRAHWNSRYRPIACHVLSFRELRLVVDCR